MNTKLFLEDLAGMTEADILESFKGEWEGKDVDRFEVLCAYESVGSWGCDSSAWALLRDKNTGELYENHGSHCSCYGFEGQFEPEKTTAEYLLSDKFNFLCGGYDNNEDQNRAAVRLWLHANIKPKEAHHD